MGEISATLNLILKVVAVTIGTIGAGFVGKLVSPWIAKTRKRQSGVTLLSALLGGAAMWLAFQGFGGSGLGPGPGGGPGNGGGERLSSAPRDNGKNPQAHTVTITILGGEKVVEQRFYAIDQEKPCAWPELILTISSRKQQDPLLREIEIVIYKDSVARNNPAVTELVNWARSNGFTPHQSFPDRNAP